MKSALNPYISFNGNAREAMEFYKTVFGGTLTLTTYEGFHVSEDPAEANKIMHGMLLAENGITFMGSDTPNHMGFTADSRINMALSGDDEAELRGYFEKLSAGGKVEMPLAKAPWGDSFGSCVDPFGVSWMVNIAGKK